MKKLLLSTLLLSSFNVLALEEKSNCTVSELDKDKSHFCLIKNKDYYIKEVLSDYIELTEKERAMKEGLNFYLYKGKYEIPPTYNQYKRLQKIKNIPKELFEKNINFENQRGLGIITTEDGNLYTTRVGYIQENGHYLEIENNEIEEFKLEKLKNPKKIISMYNLYVLDKDNTLWKKSNNKWSKLDIKNVYDFAYTEYGKIYILSESGIYFGEDKGELSKLELMKIDIEESLYKNKIEEKDYREYVMKSLFNESSKIKITENEFNKTKFVLKSDLLLNKDFKVNIIDNEIKISNGLFNFYDVESIHYRNSVEDNKLFDGYYIKESNLPEKYSYDYNTYFIIESKNIIKTKYNGNILFETAEKEILYDSTYLNNPISRYEIKSEIRMSLQTETHYFVLRSNGMLTIIDKETKELKEIYNVNRIDKLVDVKILIDPNFKNQYEDDINEYEVLDIEDIDEDEKVFVFEFKDFESLNNENIKKHLRPN